MLILREKNLKMFATKSSRVKSNRKYSIKIENQVINVTSIFCHKEHLRAHKSFTAEMGIFTTDLDSVPDLHKQNLNLNNRINNRF